MEKITHLGIYGILIKDGKILLIQKSRGPYNGKLDLPGGKPEFGETILETFIHEIYEETSITVLQARHHNYFTCIIHDLEKKRLMYHIGIIFKTIQF